MDKQTSEAVTRTAFRLLDNDNRLKGLLLFGSRVFGNVDARSDYDILAITNLPRSSEVVVEDGMVLDFIFGTPGQFRRRMNLRTRDNNNFTLNNFAESIILYDPQNVASRLQTEAKKMYVDGPVPMTVDEALDTAHALRKMLRVVKSRIERSHKSSEENMLNILRLDEIASKAVYAFFRAERRWTQAFFKVVREQLIGFPEFQHLWEQHVATFSNVEEHLRTGTALIDSVCARLAQQRGLHRGPEESPMNLGNVDILDE
ncbi:MAG: hypothetical protein ABSE51_11070 [Terracidiphilus sp.]|jgi:predicted nucleotidyltransferase